MKNALTTYQNTLSNTEHKVFDLMEGRDPDLSLAYWAEKYLVEEVRGIQATNTLHAKVRDLKGFIEWYSQMNGHARIEDWLPQDTKGYLAYLERLERAPTTVNRIFATLRRFARWVNEQPGSPFRSGLPTRGIKELAIEEPGAKKIDRKDIFALFKAAENLTLTSTRKNARPWRNRAILAILFFTGLRVSELCQLNRSQYDGRYFSNVKRKGNSRGKVYLSADCRRYLDDYLQEERPNDDPEEQSPALFLPVGGGKPVSRGQVASALNLIADEANKHRSEKNKIHLHPHRLRHTFGSMYREKSRSDTETAAALGHSGLKYVGRYVRKTDKEREALLDDLGIE